MQTRYPNRPGYQQGSVTSQAAAESVTESAATQRERVLRFLRENGPATDQEILGALNLRDQTGCPRRTELSRQGRVRDSGQKRANRSGRAAVVWEITPSDKGSE
jgi:predicted ArsR family transcriptional regulator